MAKGNKNHNLKVDSIDEIIEAFLDQQESKIIVEKTINKPDAHWIFRFKKDDEKRPSSILNCYIKKLGVSFMFQGKDQTIAKMCADFLVENASVKINNKKAFTVHGVNEEQVKVVIEFLEESNCSVEEKANVSENILGTWKAEGKYKDCIHITFYTNGTLLIQGRPNNTFSSFIEIASEIFNPSVIKKEHLNIFEISNTEEIISKNLKEHLPFSYDHVGEKLDAIMAPSLALLNCDLELTDFSAFAFPVLRGAEGILKKQLGNHGISIKEGFGEFFRFDKKDKEIKWVKDYSGLFPSTKYRGSLLHLYSFFNKNRHSTFHIDASPETSRILTYEEAYELVKTGLHLIDTVYEFQN